MTNNETIFALSSGAGISAIAVVRISGAHAREITENLTGISAPTARHAYHATLRDADGVIDDAVFVYFAAPNSFTGEDVAEFYIHGSPAVIRRLLDSLGKIAGVRAARAGEFTRRAFDNDKMDLTQTESLADLLHAQSESARRAALRGLAGENRDLYMSWREKLLGIYALATASIDFDDDNLPADLEQTIATEAAQLLAQINIHTETFVIGDAMTHGYKIALVGAVNAGKSTLFNALCARDCAITSEIAGTTRDVLEMTLEIAGFLVKIYDTAGLRDSADEIEKIGISRAKNAAENANLILYCVPVDDAVDDNLVNEKTIIVRTKDDENTRGGISIKNNFGLNDLRETLARRITRDLETADNDPILSSARVRDLTREIADALKNAVAEPQMDLRAEHLRIALNGVGKIVGETSLNDVLDGVFSRLCIGK